MFALPDVYKCNAKDDEIYYPPAIRLRKNSVAGFSNSRRCLEEIYFHRVESNKGLIMFQNVAQAGESCTGKCANHSPKQGRNRSALAHFINIFHLPYQYSPSKTIASHTNTLTTHLFVYLGSPPNEPIHPARINKDEKYDNDSECKA